MWNSTVIRRTEATLCVGTTILIRRCISGLLSLQASIRKPLSKYAAVFSDELSKKCALVAPMELSVDKSQWCTQKNRRPHRPVSNFKQEEIRKQTDEMLDSQLIRPSNSIYWSQVLMVPKANGSLRFCVDFRSLNDASKAEALLAVTEH